MNNVHKHMFYIVICRDLKNNEIMSLSNNSLDTFTNLIKLYVGEIVNTNVFTLQNYIFVQFWICAMMYS